MKRGDQPVAALLSPTYGEQWSPSHPTSARKGDVVLLLSPNSIFFPIVCLSVMSLGAIIATTNPLNTNREINKQIADSKPIILFTTTDLVPKLADSNLSIVQIGSGAGNRRIVNTLEQMMTAEPNRNRIKERVTQDDTTTLLYSSGTTGASKGVICSHRNLIPWTVERNEINPIVADSNFVFGIEIIK